MCPTLGLTLRSQSWWMNGAMACTCRMTRWPAFWPRTGTRTLPPSLATWMLKSRTFFESQRFDKHQRCRQRLRPEGEQGDIRMRTLPDSVGRFSAVFIGAGRRGDSIMAKNIAHKKAKDEETLSNQEIWRTILYLDPAVKRKTWASGVIITLLALFSIVCAVVALLYSRGL